ncbi:MAG: TonB-dependent receptor [Acidobacteria bacterium]|nr:TonB-dependent receptor [Acidobacteriota bacterium]
MARMLLILLLAANAAAQVDTGTISGLVRDASGAAITGAKVHLRQENTGISLSVASNDAGLYVSPPLRAGTYVVEVEAQGFEKGARRVLLEVSQRVSLDFDLAVGAVTQTVEVKEAGAILQTETSTLSNLRTEKAIKDLPLNGRNFAQLIGLAAGAMPAQTQQGGSPITMKRGVTGYAINGTRLEENNFLLDGINNNENHNGLGILIFPPIEAVQEFRVESSVANAQFGRGGGGTINLSYKSGGRDYHGGLFHFFRNSALDARNFFDNPNDKKPPFKSNQFGGFFGGRLNPVAKDARTFFFVNYQGARIRQAQNYISNVPTGAFRNGDFSASAQRVYDPLTQRQPTAGRFERDQFPGNIIPAGRIDRVGQNILNLYPQPNLGTGVANNFLYAPVRITTENGFDIKIDRQFSANDTAWGRVSHGNSDLTEPSFLPVPAIGNGPGVPGLNTQPVNQVVLSETHIFSPASFNEARFGFTRLNLRALNPNYGRNVSQEIGVPGANVPGDILTSGLNIFSITGLQALGDNGFSPAVIVSENWQWNDNFTHIRGRHTLKFGGEVQRRRYNAFQSNVLRGTMSFGTDYTQNPASPQGTGLGAAEAVLGRPISGSIRFLNGTRGFRRTELALYAQDDFKISDRLTLNLGVRYEDFLGWPWTEVNNRLYQFVAEKEDVIRVGTGGVPGGAGVQGDHNNLGPRFGFAWRAIEKTVVRGGYGLYYSAPQLDITRNLASNPPEFIVFAFNNSQFDFPGARPASAGFERPPAGTLNGATINGIHPLSRTSYTQQWNFSIQRQLPASFSLTVAYAGTKGTKLEARPDINQPVPGTTTIAQRRPFPRFAAIPNSENRHSSIYHGLQVTAERRLARGLNLLAGYTYSHSIDEASSHFASPMNLRNFRLDRGNSDFDVRNRLVGSWTCDLPFRAQGGWNHLIGGWQLNGIVSLYDGLPFSVSSATNTLNIGSGTRADRLRSGELPAGQRTLDRWFDITAFAPPGPQQFGNGGRNILRGPGTAQADLSVFKELYFSEKRGSRLQFRGEFFNITNTPQLNNPATTIGAAGAGSIRSAGSPLTLQRTPRQIQLALKLYF